MSLTQQTKHLLLSNRILPSKRFGQHFTVDSSLLEKLISYAEVDSRDVVLDIGAGLGFLTERLSRRCKRVLAIEFDPRLVKSLRGRFQDMKNIKLIEGDILNVAVPQFNKVISTPPYFISSHLLFWLLGRPFKLALLTFQKEFANRLAASIGSRNYGRLTVTTYYRAEVQLLDNVPRTAFYPAPEVDSIIVKLKPKSKPPFKVKDEQAFFDLVQTTFAQKNKKLRNSVLLFLQKRGITYKKAQELADSLAFHGKRVRALSPEDLGALTNEILEKTSFPQ